MPQTFAGFSGVPDPCEVLLAAGGKISLYTLADTGVTWQDGTTGTISADTVATSAYGGTSVDNTAAVYYALVVKGSPMPVLVKEQDIGAGTDELLGGTPSWAKWRRLENGSDYPTSQP